MTSGTRNPGPWVEDWLSSPRFSAYLRAAHGDRRLALECYEWNATLSAAFLHDLAHFEVALRNAYDRSLTTSASMPHWTTDPYRLFPIRWRTARDGTRIDANRTPREQIERAVRAAGPGAPSGKIIAELSLGFWRYLSTTGHHDRLWIPYLHTAFVSGTRRTDVDRPVGRLHRLRNRIAHHEPLLLRDKKTHRLLPSSTHLIDAHTDLLTVTGLISPRLRDYLTGVSTVRTTLDYRPPLNP